MEQPGWQKIGKIIDPSSDIPEGYTHATVPIIYPLEGNLVRIFFSSRNSSGQSHPFYLDFDIQKLEKQGETQGPLMDVGDPGCFDDSGVMPSCIIKRDSALWMYYIGWNLGVTVPFRNSVGIAVSTDEGITWERLFKGPVIDRTATEPHFCASCEVMEENGIFRCWYLNSVRWEKDQDGKMIHHYHIKYAESDDGIHWKREGIVAIDFANDNEYAISTPRVRKVNGKYVMWFSCRGDAYTIGYAESEDGIIWQRLDRFAGIQKGMPGEWDGDMICYPFVFQKQETLYMAYNGNGYGFSGIGLAVKTAVDASPDR